MKLPKPVRRLWQQAQAHFAERSRPELREIATTRDGRDITRPYTLPLLLSQDAILQAKGGGDIEEYEKLLTDDEVQSTFQQRRLAVISKEWEVVPGGDKRIDKMAANWLQEQLAAAGWDAITNKMLYGVFYGYAVAELLYARDGQYVALDAIRVRKPRRFRYAPAPAEGGPAELRLITLQNLVSGEVLPPRKFWEFHTGADNDDEPYGLGLAHYLYWPVYFKRNGIKFWLTFLEKFGMPTAKGTYGPNAQPDEKKRLLAALRAIQTDSAIIIPEGMTTELIEAARSGTSDYATLFDKMNEQIEKIVLSQTATTKGTPGRLGAESERGMVKDEVVKADSDLINDSFNRGPAIWLTAWNFPGAAPPKVWRRIEREADLLPVAQKDKLIHDMGFQPSEQYINETYGGEWKAASPPPPPPVPPGTRPQPGAPADTSGPTAFAESPLEQTGGDSSAPADLIADQLERAGDPLIAEWVATLAAMLERAGSLSELRAMLLAAYGELPTEQLGTLMAAGMMAATAAGRFDAHEQSRG